MKLIFKFFIFIVFIKIKSCDIINGYNCSLEKLPFIFDIKDICNRYSTEIIIQKSDREDSPNRFFLKKFFKTFDIKKISISGTINAIGKVFSTDKEKKNYCSYILTTKFLLLINLMIIMI